MWLTWLSLGAAFHWAANISDICSILSNLIIIVVFAFYFKQVVGGTSTPNPATWFIWFVVTIMNAITYYHTVGEDIFKFMITAIVACNVSLIFAYSIWRGKLTKLGKIDGTCLFLAISVGVFWQTTGNNVITNLLLQVILMISFFPTISGLLWGDGREKAPPWLLATVAYTFLALAIITDWKGGGWLALIHPVVVGILGNGSVGLLALKQKQ